MSHFGSLAARKVGVFEYYVIALKAQTYGSTLFLAQSHFDRTFPLSIVAHQIPYSGQEDDDNYQEKRY